jgi:hypothetical protein
MRQLITHNDYEANAFQRWWAAARIRELLVVFVLSVAITVLYGVSSQLGLLSTSFALATGLLTLGAITWIIWMKTVVVISHYRSNEPLFSKTSPPDAHTALLTALATSEYYLTFTQYVETVDHLQLRLRTDINAVLVDAKLAAGHTGPTQDWIELAAERQQTENYTALPAHELFENGPAHFTALKNALAATLAARGLWLRSLVTSVTAFSTLSNDTEDNDDE